MQNEANLMVGQVKDILYRHWGRESAIKGREIAAILGLRDDRQIRMIIRDLIKSGVPIASSTEEPAGYYIATGKEETEEYIRVTRSRLVQDAYRLRDFKRASLTFSGRVIQGKLGL